MVLNFSLVYFLFFLTFLSFSRSQDPTCSSGLPAGSACCQAQCTRCGGSGCGSLPGGPDNCCTGAVLNSGRFCNSLDPPCIIGSEDNGPPSNDTGDVMNSTNTTTTIAGPGNALWKNIDSSLQGRPQPRHEACFVMVAGRGFLIGGRGNRRVDVFNPKNRTWSAGPPMPTQMHHMQCVGWRGSVYIPSSWFGGFPSEENNERMWVLNARTLTWTSRPGLPKDRLRGGGAVAVFKNKLYLATGNIGGHGPPSRSVGWFDYYDLITREWVTNLPDMPDPRDHVGGAIVKGRFCIAGGRDGGQSNFFAALTTSTWCFNFRRQKWINTKKPIPTARAGAATARICGGRMMIVGGEGSGRNAFDEAEIFDGKSWSSGGKLVRERHGSGLGVSKCGCGQVFIASGSGARGGSPELDSTEGWFPDGQDRICDRY